MRWAQLCPGCFREGFVGGVTDQEMAEAEAVLPNELPSIGADQLAPHERRQPRRHLSLLGCQRLHGAAVEDLALDPYSSTRRSAGSSWLEPRRQ